MTNLTISQKGIDLIKSFEGLSLKSYKPVSQETYFTIGYGHYGADVKQGEVITEKTAEDLLRKDLQKFVNGVNSLVKSSINQNMFDALLSFVYNCGVGTLEKSTMLQLINKGDFENASKEFVKFCHGAGGVFLQGLKDRRSQEAHLFMTPVHHTITLKTACNLRKAPNASSEIIKVLPAGSTWIVNGKEGDFYNIGGYVTSLPEYVTYK